MNTFVDNILASCIKRILGSFFENGSSHYDKVHINLWSGNLIFENLKVKKTILDALNIPIRLLLCSLRKMHLVIPWGRLSTDPIVVEIEGLCVLMEPDYNLSPESKAKATQAAKQAKLLRESFISKNIEDTSKTIGSSFLQSIKELSVSLLLNSVLTNIINNIRVNIRNIHIRYEDQASCPISSFCCGMMVESFSLNADTPDDWDSLDSHDMDTYLFSKLIGLSKQSIYWNPLSLSNPNLCSRPLAGKLDSEVEFTMLHRLRPESNQQQYLGSKGHRFMLLPMNMETRFSALVNLNDKSVKAVVHLVIPSMDTAMDDQQGLELIALSTNLMNYSLVRKQSEFRPNVSVTHGAAEWWRYAIHSVLFQIRTVHESHSWDRFHKNALYKLVYIELYRNIMNFPVPESALKKLQSVVIKEAGSKQYELSCGSRIEDEMVDVDSKLFQFLLSTSRMRRKLAEYQKESKSNYWNGTISGLNGTEANSLDDVASKLQLRPLGKLTRDAEKLFVELEYVLSYDQIVYFRALAETDSLYSVSESNGVVESIFTWFSGQKNEPTLTFNDRIQAHNGVSVRRDASSPSASKMKLELSLSVVVGSSTMALAFAHGYNSDINVNRSVCPNDSIYCQVLQQPKPFMKSVMKRLMIETKITTGSEVHVAVEVDIKDMEVLEASSVAQLCSTSITPVSFAKFSWKRSSEDSSPWQSFGERNFAIGSSSRDIDIPEESSMKISFELQKTNETELKPMRKVNIVFGGTNIFIHNNSPMVLLFDNFCDRAGWYGEPLEIRNYYKSSQKIKKIETVPPDPKKMAKENISFAIGNRSDTQLTLSMSSAMVYIAPDRTSFDRQTGSFLTIRGGDLLLTTIKNLPRSIIDNNNMPTPATCVSDRLGEQCTDYSVDEIAMTLTNSNISIVSFIAGKRTQSVDYLDPINNMQSKMIFSTTTQVSPDIPWLRMELNHGGIVVNLNESKLLQFVRCLRELSAKPVISISGSSSSPAVAINTVVELLPNTSERESVNEKTISDDELEYFEYADNDDLGANDTAIVSSASSVEASQRENANNENEDDMEFFDAIEAASDHSDADALSQLKELFVGKSAIEINREIRKREEHRDFLEASLRTTTTTTTSTLGEDTIVLHEIQLCTRELDCLRSMYGDAVVAEIQAANVMFPIITSNRRKSAENHDSKQRKKRSPAEESVYAFIESMERSKRFEDISANEGPQKFIFSKRRTESSRKNETASEFKGNFQIVQMHVKFGGFILRLSKECSTLGNEILKSTISDIEIKASIWSTATTMTVQVSSISIENCLDKRNSNASIEDGASRSRSRQFVSTCCKESELCAPYINLQYTLGTVVAATENGWCVEKSHVVDGAIRKLEFLLDQELLIAIARFSKSLLLQMSLLPSAALVSNPPSRSSSSKPKKSVAASFIASTNINVNMNVAGIAMVVPDISREFTLLELATGGLAVNIIGNITKYPCCASSDADPTSAIDISYSMILGGGNVILQPAVNLAKSNLVKYIGADSSGEMDKSGRIMGTISKVSDANANYMIDVNIEMEQVAVTLDLSILSRLCTNIALSPLLDYMKETRNQLNPTVNQVIPLKLGVSKTNVQKKKTPIDVNSLLTKLNMNMSMSSRGVSVSTATTFNDSQLTIENIASLSLGIESVSLVVSIGGNSSRNSLINGDIVIVNRIKMTPVTIGNLAISESYQMYVVAASRISSDHSSHTDNITDRCICNNLGISLENEIFQSPYRPKLFTIQNSNELQLVSSISPVRINFSRELLQQIAIFGDNMKVIIASLKPSIGEVTSAFKALQRSAKNSQAGFNPSMTSSNVGYGVLSKKSNMKLLVDAPSDSGERNAAGGNCSSVTNPWKFGCSALIYEVSIQFSNPASDACSTDSLGHFVMRGMELLMVGQDPRECFSKSIGDELAVSDGNFPNNKLFALVRLAFIISSVDFCVNMPNHSIKRLLFSDVAMAELSYLQPSKLPPIAELLDSNSSLLSEANIIAVNVDVTTELDISISVCTKYVNAVVDGVILNKLIRYFQEAMSNLRPMDSMLVPSLSDIDNSSPHTGAKPVCRPISKLLSTIDAVADSELVCLQPKSGTLLTYESLCLPLQLTGIKIAVVFENNGLWLPSKEICNETDGLKQLPKEYLYLSTDALINMHISSVNSSILSLIPSSRMQSNETELFDFISVTGQFGPMLVRFIDSAPDCLYETTFDLLQELSSNPRDTDLTADHDNEKYTETPEVMFADVVEYRLTSLRSRSDSLESLVDDKEDYSWLKSTFQTSLHNYNRSDFIVCPVIGKFIFLGSVARIANKNSNDDEYDAVDEESVSYSVVKTIDIRIENIDINLFLNLQPFVDIYEGNLKPLVDLVKSFSSSSSSRTNRKPKTKPVNNTEQDCTQLFDRGDLEHQLAIIRSELQTSENPPIKWDDVQFPSTLIGVNNIIHCNSLISSFPHLFALGSSSLCFTIDQFAINVIDNFGTNQFESTAINVFRIATRNCRVSTKLEAIPRVLPLMLTEPRCRELFVGDVVSVDWNSGNTAALTEQLAVVDIQGTIEVEYYYAGNMTWNTLIDQSTSTLHIQIPWNLKMLQVENMRGPIVWRMNSSVILPCLLPENQAEIPSPNESANHLAAIFNHLPTNIINSIQQKPVAVSLTGDASLNMNICPNLIDSVIALVEKVKTNVFLRDQKQTLNQSPYSTTGSFVVKNEIGIEFEIWTKEEKFSQTIPVAGERAVNILLPKKLSSGYELNSNRQLDPLEILSRTINIRIGQCVFPNISICGDKNGSRLYKWGSSSLSSDEFTFQGPPDIIISLISELGAKRLTVRSTLRLYNTLNCPVLASLALVSSESSTSNYLNENVWDALIPIGECVGLPVTADGICFLNNLMVNVRLSLPNCADSPTKHFESISLPLPSFGNSQNVSLEGRNDGQENNSDLNTNDLWHRFQSSRSRGAKSSRSSFCYWLKANAIENDSAKTTETVNMSSGINSWDLVTSHKGNMRSQGPVNAYDNTSLIKIYPKAMAAVNYNAKVEIVSDVKHAQTHSQESAEPSLIELVKSISKNSDEFFSRNLTLEAPIKVVNCLLGNIEVKLLSPKRHGVLFFGSSTTEICDVLKVDNGNSVDCLKFHAMEDISVSVRLPGSVSYSSSMIICRCDSNKISPKTTLYTDTLFSNNATLTVHCDVMESHGCRSLYLYVPYWVVSPKNVHLWTRHVSSTYRPLSGATNVDLNGDDDLAADQLGEIFASVDTDNNFLPSSDVVVATEELPTTPGAVIIGSSINLAKEYAVCHFSYSNYEVFKTSISLSIDGLSWSESLTLSNVPTSIQLMDRQHADNARIKHLTLSSKPAEKTFGKTKIVFLQERFAIINHMDGPIFAKQCYIRDAYIATMNPKELNFMDWQACPQGPAIQISLDSVDGWSWSCEIPLIAPGNASKTQVIRLDHCGSNQMVYVGVTVTCSTSRVAVEILKPQDTFALYRVENYCSIPIRLNQSGHDSVGLLTKILPLHFAEICQVSANDSTTLIQIESRQNDDPQSLSSELASWNKLGIVNLNENQKKTDVSTINTDMSIEMMGEFHMNAGQSIRVFALYSCGIRVIIIVDNDILQEVVLLSYLLQSRLLACVPSRVAVSVNVPMMSCCLSNRQDTMMVFVCKGLDINVALGIAQLNTSWKCIDAKMALDQMHLELQSSGTKANSERSSMVIYSSPIANSSKLEPTEALKCLDMAINLQLNDQSLVIPIQKLAILLSSSALNINGNTVIPFAKLFIPTIATIKKFTAYKKKISLEQSLHHLLSKDLAKQLKCVKHQKNPQLFFQDFYFGDIQLQLTVDSNVVSILPQISKFATVNILASYILGNLSTLTAIDNCTFAFSSVHACQLNPLQLVAILRESIMKQLPSQMISLLKSVQVFETPIAIIQLLGEGLTDFIYFPSTGGFVAGVSSLLRHSVSSTMLSVGVLASVAASVTALTGEMTASFVKKPVESHVEATPDDADSEVMDEHTRDNDDIQESAIVIMKPTRHSGLASRVSDAVTTGFRIISETFTVSSAFLQVGAEQIVGSSRNSIDISHVNAPPRPSSMLVLDMHGGRLPFQLSMPHQISTSMSSHQNRYMHRNNAELGPELLFRALQGNAKRSSEIYISHVPFINYTYLLLTNRSLMLLCDSFSTCEILRNISVRNFMLASVEFNVTDMYSFLDLSLLENSNAREVKGHHVANSIQTSMLSPQKKAPRATTEAQISPHSLRSEYEPGSYLLPTSPQSLGSFSESTSHYFETGSKATSPASSASSSVSLSSLSFGASRIDLAISPHIRLKLRSLRGSPVLILHYLSEDPMHRKSANGYSSSSSRSLRPGSSHSQNQIAEPGISRLKSKKLKFDSHEQLVEFLLRFLLLTPSLVNDQIDAYMSSCWIKRDYYNASK